MKTEKTRTLVDIGRTTTGNGCIQERTSRDLWISKQIPGPGFVHRIILALPVQLIRPVGEYVHLNPVSFFPFSFFFPGFSIFFFFLATAKALEALEAFFESFLRSLFHFFF